MIHDDLWEFLNDLSTGIDVVQVVRRSMEKQDITGPEWSVLGVAIDKLIDCHRRFDLAIGNIEPKEEQGEEDRQEEGAGGVSVRPGPEKHVEIQ